MNPVLRSAVTAVALWLGAALVAAAADAKEFERRKAPPRRFTGVNFAEPEAAGKTNKVEDNLLPKPSLGTIDRAIRKPFEIFSPEDSMGPALEPPVRRPSPVPRAQSRRERQKKDVQDNWAFSTPEEIFGLPTAETMLDLPEFGPNGELKPPKTSFERYLERQELERQAAATNQAATGILPGWARPDDETKAEATGRDGGPASEKDHSENNRSGGYEFVNMSGAPAWRAATPNGEGWLNFGGPASAGLIEKPAAKDVAREQRMQEFRQLLENRSAASPARAWSVGGSSPLASPATMTPSPAFSVAPPFSGAAASPAVSGAIRTPATHSPPASTPSYFTPVAPPPASTPVVRPQPGPSPFATPFDLPRRKL